ncbi:hypothetical protein D1872_257230 [compost metagenome]
MRFQCGTGRGQRPSLRASVYAHAVFIHARHRHQNAHRLYGIEENLAVVELIRVRIVQAANDLPANGRPLHGLVILRQAALPPAIERQNGHAVGRIRDLVEPVAAVARVSVKHRHRRPLVSGRSDRTCQLGMYPCTSHPCKV